MGVTCLKWGTETLEVGRSSPRCGWGVAAVPSLSSPGCSVSLISPRATPPTLTPSSPPAGRGLKSHAYIHSVQFSHHVFLNLHTLKFYCLPDNYEIIDSSLEDITVRQGGGGSALCVPSLGATESLGLEKPWMLLWSPPALPGPP